MKKPFYITTPIYYPSDKLLIGAGEEHDIITGQTLIACHGIGGHGAVGMADVQLGRGIIDGGRDVEIAFRHIIFLHFQRLFYKIKIAPGKSKGDKIYRGTTLVRTKILVPQNALTGAPVAAYLSTAQLQDHVR